MKTYEFTYVIDHQLSDDEIDALFDRVADVTPERVQAVGESGRGFGLQR